MINAETVKNYNYSFYESMKTSLKKNYNQEIQTGTYST